MLKNFICRKLGHLKMPKLLTITDVPGDQFLPFFMLQ
jgi:hypothetical protein